MSHAAGSIISKYVDVQDYWGLTENMKVVDLTCDREDFEYYAVDLKYSGIEFKPVKGEGDLCELVMHRTEDSYPYTSYFHNRPNETVFRPGDLWRPHPDLRKEPYTWKFVRRVDDLIVFKNGVNFQPLAYELKDLEHALVQSATISGNGHTQPVLLLELQNSEMTDSEKSKVLGILWTESVVPINKIAPKIGQITKTHVILVTKERPVERTGKGTVARNPNDMQV